MKFLFSFYFFCFICCIPIYGQEWQDLYEQRLHSKLGFSYEKLIKASKENDAYNFIALGYFLNANNIMYRKTSDQQYLLYNKTIIDEIRKRSDEYSIKWLWKEKQNDGTLIYSDNIVWEGYFYRYLSEYLYLLKKSNIFTDDMDELFMYIKNGFDKWINKSFIIYNDAYSLLFHIRIHIVSNWGVVALYLDDYSSANIYKDFLDLLDNSLKELLEIKEVKGNMYYSWQSNYKTQFTNSLRSKSIKKPIIQDVSHANHVVNYIITSYELNRGKWTDKDIKYLSNTLSLLIWDKKNKSFSDNVDGSSSLNKEFRGQGWKQSDGWMKLSNYDLSLKEIYKEYYRNNKEKVYSSSMALQFYANLL